ncbi:MAG: response regulator [Pseudomonadota bacterium]
MNAISVLIVDDNEDDRYLLKRKLKSAGFELHIHEKNDGQEALEFMQDYDENYKLYAGLFPPMVIFLDINMPRLDGYGFLEEFAELREKYDFSSCVLMMFTSSEREDDKEKALSYEFVSDYILKGGYDIDQLKQILEKVSGDQ